MSHRDQPPDWARQCLESPVKGVDSFLQELCSISGARYAHIRVQSRLQRFYTLVRSIGPYEEIGWRRRFHFIDSKEPPTLAYQFIDYAKTTDCHLLKAKYVDKPELHRYLDSLTYGFWIPLTCASIPLGYVTLSWTGERPDVAVAKRIKKYIEATKNLAPLLFSACRSVLTDHYLQELWAAARLILSSQTEALCYDRIAAACMRLWGADATTYIGKPDMRAKNIEIVTVDGHRSAEARSDDATQTIPLGNGLFSYALDQDHAVVSMSLAADTRFRYHSMKAGGGFLGSAVAARLSRSIDGTPLAIVSVEHELENYFDSDDVRYMTAIARIGSDALTAHQTSSERIARELDTLFTQMSHDVAEPLTALVADADVLAYQTSVLKASSGSVQMASMTDIANRAANILETSLTLNRQVRKQLDEGVDGAATRVTAGRVNLYRVLNALINTWEDRAASQGVEFRSWFGQLKGIEVQCDETELKAAIGHLFGNAIKYSFWGRRQSYGTQTKFGRFVSVRGRISFGMAIIEIQNYGIGILKSELTSVKEKFYRGDLAKREGRAGTGRGLWSATTFVESLGGRLDVKSEYHGSNTSSPEGPYFTSVRVSVPYVTGEEI